MSRRHQLLSCDARPLRVFNSTLNLRVYDVFRHVPAQPLHTPADVPVGGKRRMDVGTLYVSSGTVPNLVITSSISALKLSSALLTSRSSSCIRFVSQHVRHICRQWSDTSALQRHSRINVRPSSIDSQCTVNSMPSSINCYGISGSARPEHAKSTLQHKPLKFVRATSMQTVQHRRNCFWVFRFAPADVSYHPHFPTSTDASRSHCMSVPTHLSTIPILFSFHTYLSIDISTTDSPSLFSIVSSDSPLDFLKHAVITMSLVATQGTVIRKRGTRHYYAIRSAMLIVPYV